MDSKKKKPETSQAMRYSEATVDFTHIITLPQMRTEFDPQALRQLVDSIVKSGGLINPQIVTNLPEKEFWEYSKLVCGIYEKQLSQSTIRSIKKKIGSTGAWVMIAGERRLLALDILWNEGCSDCQKEHGGKKVGKGVCWQKHFGTLSKVIPVRVPITKDPSELLTIQLEENTQSPPNSYELANAVAKFAIFLKSQNRNWSWKKIAQRMKRSPEMVRRALTFFALPVSIKKMVSQKKIHYGLAVELARLQDQIKYKEVDLLREINMALVDKKLSKVAAFADHVSGTITAYIQKQNNEITTLELMVEELSAEKRMASVLSPDAINLARILVSNFTKILGVWESADNRAFTKDRYLTIGGFVEDYAKVVPLMEQLLPYVEDKVTVIEAKEMRAGIVRIKKIVRIKQRKRAVAR